MRPRPASWRWLVWLLTLALLTGCTSAVSRPEPSASATDIVSPLPSSTATSGRPLLSIPAVRPRGFADPPAGQGLARYSGQPVEWLACGSGLVCTQVLAPLDYDAPDGTALTLSLVKRPATASVSRGPLFMNPGGPGGSGINLVRSFSPTGLTDFDLIGWDPRGIGASTPATCFAGADLDRHVSIDDTPDTAAEKQDLLAEERSFGASCLARSGALLEHLSTAETVRDLDLLRDVLGAERINYLGFSYGTLIGSLYAQNYPTRVARMVLDGATDITAGRSVSQLSGFERAFAHFATWCSTRPCGLGSTAEEVSATVVGLLTRLDQQPLPAGERTLSQQQAVQAVFNAMYGGEAGWTGLAPELRAALAGDGSALLAHADRADYRNPDGTYNPLTYGFPVVRCRDSRDTSVETVERRAAAEDATAPMLRAVNGPDYLCTQWPVRSAPRRPTITATGAPTIVVVGTTGDPATPYEWARAMAEQLDSAVLLTFDGEGHTAYDQSPCVRAQVRRYLVEGVTPATGTRC